MSNDSLVKINTELHKKLQQYKEILNKERKKEGVKGKVKQTTILNNILEDYFKDKILTNDFIGLKTPRYFNYKELTTNKEVITSINKPFQDLEYLFIINKVPNNLDKFNLNYNSYCYNKKGFHKGIYIYSNILLDDLVNCYISDEDLILVFEYDENSQDLKIGLVEYKNIDLYFTVQEKVKLLELLKKHEEFKKQVITINNDKSKTVDVGLLLNSFNIIVSYAQLKKMEQDNFITDTLEKYVNGKINSIEGLNSISTIDIIQIFTDLCNERNQLKETLTKYNDINNELINKLEKINQIEEFTEDDFKELLGDH